MPRFYPAFRPADSLFWFGKRGISQCKAKADGCVVKLCTSPSPTQVPYIISMPLSIRQTAGLRGFLCLIFHMGNV